MADRKCRATELQAELHNHQNSWTECYLFQSNHQHFFLLIHYSLQLWNPNLQATTVQKYHHTFAPFTCWLVLKQSKVNAYSISEQLKIFSCPVYLSSRWWSQSWPSCSSDGPARSLPPCGPPHQWTGSNCSGMCFCVFPYVYIQLICLENRAAISIAMTKCVQPNITITFAEIESTCTCFLTGLKKKQLRESMLIIHQMRNSKFKFRELINYSTVLIIAALTTF